MRVLELGRYIVPSFAGMLLAEQGHEVVKLTWGVDPVQKLRRGDELWQWFNGGKELHEAHFGDVEDWLDCTSTASRDRRPFDIVIDNIRAEAWEGELIPVEALARFYDLTWVSLRSEVEGRSFDIIAQARSIMEYTPHVPFYLGDTVGGTFLAFKALAARRGHHYVIGHASCLQKLVEGELADFAADVPRESGTNIWWDTDPYVSHGGFVAAGYNGEVQYEVVRDREWKREHLFADEEGRILI